MLEGKTSDCLAIANTAILIKLIEALIERGVITRPDASSLLRDAVDSLENCPNSDHSNFVDATTIIRKELMLRISRA